MGEDGRWILFPDGRLHVDIEFDLVAVGILDVETVGDGVIGGADESRPGGHQLVASLAEFGVRLPDLEPEVIHADPAPARDRGRVLADLDQQEFVVRSSRRKSGGREADLLARDGDLRPTQDIAIEAARAFEITDVEDKVSELFDLQIRCTSFGTQAQATPRQTICVVPDPPRADPLEFTLRWPVRGYELDSRGHVNNAVYLSWAEEIATAHAEAAGYGREWSERRGGGWVIRRTEITYHQPAVYGDEIELTVTVELVRGARGVRRTTIRRAPNGELLAEVLTEWVWVRLSDGRPTQVPRELIELAAAATAATIARRRPGPRVGRPGQSHD